MAFAVCGVHRYGCAHRTQICIYNKSIQIYLDRAREDLYCVTTVQKDYAEKILRITRLWLVRAAVRIKTDMDGIELRQYQML